MHALGLGLVLAITLLTGPEDGPTDRIGRAIAAEAARRLHDVPVSVSPTAGSLENIETLLARRGAGAAPALAIVRADLLRDAYFGQAPFDRKELSLRALAVLHDETVHVVARPDAGIASFDDLAGRRVALGDARSGSIRTARRVLAMADLGITDIVPVEMSDAEAARALLAERIDAFVAVSPIPNPAVARALEAGAVLVPVTGTAGRKLTAEEWLVEERFFPLRLERIGAEHYPTVRGDVPALRVAAILAATDGFPAPAAEDLAEALFSGLDGIRAAHPAAAAIDRERAAREIPIPLHRGARAYYELKGPLIGPVKMIVNMMVYDISAVDLEAGTFFFDGAMDLSWQDPRIGLADAPHFEIANPFDLKVQDQGTKPSGSRMIHTARIRGRLRAAFSLKRFPFDAQRLEIALEHPLLTSDDVVYMHHPGVDLATSDLGAKRSLILREDFTLEDWVLRDIRAEVRDIPYQNSRYSRYTLTLEVERRFLTVFLKEIAPVVLMVLLGLAAGLIPSDKLDGKLLLTVLALLVAVELHVSAAERMPAVGYATFTDWLYIFAYLSISLAVLQSIVEHRLHAAGRDGAAARLRRLGLLVCAAVFFGPVALLLAARAL